MTRNNSACIRLPALIICLWGMATSATGAGPDVIFGHLEGLEQFGREGPAGSGTVGLGIGNETCNIGDEPAHFFELPNTDHLVYAQNFYRLKTVAGSQRFEQIGLSWMKHTLGAVQWDACNIGCDPFPDGTELGVGCSDPYGAFHNVIPCRMGPRSAIHSYTGVLPEGGDLGPGGGCSGLYVNYPSQNHIGHVHDGISHRLQVQDVDLIENLNPGARYFGELQVITPHEYTAGNGNQNNNVSHREFTVSPTVVPGEHVFAPAAATVAEMPAFTALSGASQTMIGPAPLVDGRAFLVHKTSDLGDGLWHYEYALYNMNLDLALGSISIPIPDAVTISTIGFHAPLNHAPEPWADNYTNDPWEVVTTGGAITWSTDSFAVDPLANAVRWGTLYNFRFDANAPPQAVDATVGLFKTGDVTPAATVGPSSVGPRDCNANSIDDRCDLDCDAPGCAVVGCGEREDCTGNGIPDQCEADCNNNTTADRCELLNGTADDCNGNGVPDQCDPGGETDCNTNGAADFCDLLLGTSHDSNENGVPDECDPQLGTIYVDDDGPGDPGPGDPTVSDPAEDGSQAHPFDAIQEAIYVSGVGDVVLLADGTYTGPGNQNITYGGRTITVRSQNGPENCILDLEFVARGFDFISGETPDARLEGLTILNAVGDPKYGERSAIYINNSGPTIFNCVISESMVAAVECFANSYPTLANCRITGNRDGVLSLGSSPTIYNSVVARNRFGLWGFKGSNLIILNSTITDHDQGYWGVRSDESSVATVVNSVIWGNPNEVMGNVDIRYSVIEGGWPGAGNIDADPLFVDAEGGNYRLSSSSPAIDAGDSTVSCARIDLDANPRFLDDPDTVDTGVGPLSFLDMGAYEFVPEDCNDNGTPDAEEILLDPLLDGNGNGILDECEPSLPDCNENDIPDFCDTDCNDNGVPDDCDVADGTSTDCNGNGRPDECEPDCNANDIQDDCDIADCDGDLACTDCNANGVPDGCEIANPSWDCNENDIPDDCDPDADGDGVPDDCDICPGFSDSADCDGDSIPNGCEISVADGGLCTGEDCSADCNANGVPDQCDISRCTGLPGCTDCQSNGIPDECDIDSGSSPDDDGDGIPDECYTPDPPGLPPNTVHHATKHRYLSIDPATVPGMAEALKVELVSMRRCNGDLRRACIVDADCKRVCENDHDTMCTTSAQCGGDACIDTTPCVEHPDVGLSWWVQEPFQIAGGCLPGPCGDEDWLARLDAAEFSQVWTLDTLHIGDCEVVAVATYLVYACNSIADYCSDPLTIGTTGQPLIAPEFRGNYGDVAGQVEGTAPDRYFTPPDGFTNVVDVTTHILTKQNYGTPNKPQAHPTWVDLHGLGDGNPPQPPPPNGNPPNYIINVSDLGQILKAFAGDAWTDDPGNMDPGQCP